MNTKILIQFLKFGIVGGINTIFSLLIYYLLLYFKWNYMFANIIGYFISSILGYVLNKFWVFKFKEAKAGSSILKYYVIYGSSFSLNVIAMYLWVSFFNVSETLAPILTVLITLPYNFVLNKVWTFKEIKK
ncbi:GtrA family protein [Paenibacillus tritici]|uniref:GtrA family protein n=2 Tax=Paenibacillus tritici TaxID=1873425 RepID=A0ABX2DRE4_9BACL|nr:GtrA family protein [Paenibacillus tritici]